MGISGGSEAYKLDRRVVKQPLRRAAAETAKRKAKVKVTSSRQMLEAAVLAACILSMMLLYVSQHAQMAKLNYAVLKEQKYLESLKVQNENLNLKVMKLSSLDRIEAIARNKIKMIEPGRVEYVALDISAVNDGAVDTPKREMIDLKTQRLAKRAVKRDSL